jgi:hypothetical protein
MSFKTVAEAKKLGCWVALQAGVSWYCDGDGCYAWENLDMTKLTKEQRAAAQIPPDDITPRGYCGLYEVQFRVLD